jgi:hypothetical protein
LRSEGLQFRFELCADKHGACMPALGHFGQQADLIFNQPVCSGDVAPAQACHFANPQPRPVGEQQLLSVPRGVIAGVDVR